MKSHETDGMKLSTDEKLMVSEKFFEDRLYGHIPQKVFKNILTSSRFGQEIVPQFDKGILKPIHLRNIVLLSLDDRWMLDSSKKQHPENTLPQAYLRFQGVVPQIAAESLIYALENNPAKLKNFSRVTCALSTIALEGYRKYKLLQNPDDKNPTNTTLLEEYYKKICNVKPWVDGEHNNASWKELELISNSLLSDTHFSDFGTVTEEDLELNFEKNNSLYQLAISNVIGKTSFHEPESVVRLIQEYRETFL